MPIRISALVAAALAFAPPAAHAELTISGKPTQHVSCKDGTCAATAKRANLNTADLTNMLSGSDVTVTGFAGQDIVVAKGFGWAGTHHFAMSSSHALRINAPINVMGTSGVAITTTNGGTLAFGAKGQIKFLDTNSTLAINGTPYTLAADLATLSADIAANQSGNFALARSYDAGPDGVYTQNPITSVFLGAFEGLGNTIKNLKIRNGDFGVHVGMFYEAGAVSDLHFDRASIKATGKNVSVGILAGACGPVTNVDAKGDVSAAENSYIGGLCGVLSGNMTGAHASGKVTGLGDNGTTQNAAGGLVGLLDGGVISNSYATVKVTVAKAWIAGGLVGQTENSTYRITGSYATGVVLAGDNGVAGGLVGDNAGGHAIDNSYATGFVGGGVGSTVGGFIGINNGPVSDSYSSGGVASGSGNAVGGFIGNDQGAADLTDTYFDTTTSGQSHGVGNNTAYPGITGLTTEQFQAGLPSGFDSSIWAEDMSINDGLPYLLALSPK